MAFGVTPSSTWADFADTVLVINAITIAVLLAVFYFDELADSSVRLLKTLNPLTLLSRLRGWLARARLVLWPRLVLIAPEVLRLRHHDDQPAIDLAVMQHEPRQDVVRRNAAPLGRALEPACTSKWGRTPEATCVEMGTVPCRTTCSALNQAAGRSSRPTRNKGSTHDLRSFRGRNGDAPHSRRRSIRADEGARRRNRDAALWCILHRVRVRVRVRHLRI
jgi:hypothetical protein